MSTGWELEPEPELRRLVLVDMSGPPLSPVAADAPGDSEDFRRSRSAAVTVTWWLWGCYSHFWVW